MFIPSEHDFLAFFFSAGEHSYAVVGSGDKKICTRAQILGNLS